MSKSIPFHQNHKELSKESLLFKINSNERQEPMLQTCLILTLFKNKGIAVFYLVWLSCTINQLLCFRNTMEKLFPVSSSRELSLLCSMYQYLHFNIKFHFVIQPFAWIRLQFWWLSLKISAWIKPRKKADNFPCKHFNYFNGRQFLVTFNSRQTLVVLISGSGVDTSVYTPGCRSSKIV